ncbi:UNVERIFIED_CONTAM: hypothetical protein QOZ17_10475 [Pseudomonas aeruginosa]
MNSEKLLITSPVGPKITPTTEASSTPQLATPNSPTPGAAGATSSMASRATPLMRRASDA